VIFVALVIRSRVSNDLNGICTIRPQLAQCASMCVKPSFSRSAMVRVSMAILANVRPIGGVGPHVRGADAKAAVPPDQGLRTLIALVSDASDKVRRGELDACYRGPTEFQ
jgi:hypothetical protein